MFYLIEEPNPNPKTNPKKVALKPKDFLNEEVEPCGMFGGVITFGLKLTELTQYLKDGHSYRDLPFKYEEKSQAAFIDTLFDERYYSLILYLAIYGKATPVNGDQDYQRRFPLIYTRGYTKNEKARFAKFNDLVWFAKQPKFRNIIENEINQELSLSFMTSIDKIIKKSENERINVTTDTIKEKYGTYNIQARALPKKLAQGILSLAQDKNLLLSMEKTKAQDFFNRIYKKCLTEFKNDNFSLSEAQIKENIRPNNLPVLLNSIQSNPEIYKHEMPTTLLELSQIHRNPDLSNFILNELARQFDNDNYKSPEIEMLSPFEQRLREKRVKTRLLNHYTAIAQQSYFSEEEKRQNLSKSFTMTQKIFDEHRENYPEYLQHQKEDFYWFIKLSIVCFIFLTPLSLLVTIPFLISKHLNKSFIEIKMTPEELGVHKNIKIKEGKNIKDENKPKKFVSTETDTHGKKTLIMDKHQYERFFNKKNLNKEQSKTGSRELILGL